MTDVIMKPSIVSWSELYFHFEDYLLGIECDLNKVVTGEVYEKIYALYNNHTLLQELPYHIVHNRIFYYLNDLLEFLVKHQPEKISKFDSLYKNVAERRLASYFRGLMRTGGYLTCSDVQKLFGYRMAENITRLNLRHAFRIAHIRVWEVELVAKLLGNSRPREALFNLHVFGLTKKERFKDMGKHDSISVQWIEKYLGSDNKLEERIDSKEKIDEFLSTYKGGLLKLAGRI